MKIKKLPESIVITVASRYKTSKCQEFDFIHDQQFSFLEKEEINITFMVYECIKFLRENPDEEIKVYLECADDYEHGNQGKIQLKK